MKKKQRGSRVRSSRNAREHPKAKISKKSPSGKSSPQYLEGVLKVHRDGYGFVLSEKSGTQDVFIPARQMAGAMNGDRVLASVRVSGRDGRLEGSISEILSRGTHWLIGRLRRDKNKILAVVEEKGRVLELVIPPEGLGAAKVGDDVGLKITKYPVAGELGVGEVTQIFEKRGSEATEIDIVILKHQLPVQFSEEAIRQARHFQQHREYKPEAMRLDLRHLPFVTIDGETARDFDDAICVKPEAGGFRLWVSIADVSHYVRPDSALDRDAFTRGTSVYFPEKCIPMLPEELSNDLCSLRPNEDRLSFTCEQFIDAEGRPKEAKVYKSVIRSQARLTYKQVARGLIDDPPLLEMVTDAFHLSRLLRTVRFGRGSIDFDLPEPEIIIDLEEGGIENIIKAERNEAHFMIEEFMISANEAVARFITQKKSPGIYRVHDKPDPEKVANFQILLNNLGYQIAFPKDPNPKFFNHILYLVKGHPEEQLIQHILLRTMKQAVYSNENHGHFGLASTCYTHFTSPIRRYPDLVVHRILEKILIGRKADLAEAQELMTSDLAQIAGHTSRRERVAMEAEWEAIALKVALFMQKYVGHSYAGAISRIAKFGFFVELKEFFVEGLVHLEEVEDDYYVFDEKKHRLRGRKGGKVFKIGTEVQVTVAKVSIEERQVYFSLDA